MVQIYPKEVGIAVTDPP